MDTCYILYIIYYIYHYILLHVIHVIEQNHEGRELIFEEKRQKALEKKLGCKFIRVNTSNAKRGYDTDYEVSKIQIFISEFKDKKIKEKDNTIKEKDNKIKELEDELKKLKLQLTNESV